MSAAERTSNIGVWDLWSESVKETENLADPFFLECLEAASSNRIFNTLGDDKLKTSLSIVNCLMNDPKTRVKGLTLFNDLVTQVNTSRFVGYQDAIISALHLVVKGLDSPIASSVLASLLPNCHSLTEVNQTVTSAIIPKILSHFCGDKHIGGKDSTIQKCLEGLELLKTCLSEYHGPCGQFREKLERNLVQFIDNENKESVELMSDVFPLLSYAGGGGNAGEKHSKDWNTMLNKFLHTAYSVLFELFEDGGCASTLEPENPYDAEELLGYKKISENKVLLRMSLLKRRLMNILVILTAYLRSSFPAPKLVSLKGIIKLLQYLTSVNPISTDKSSVRKENVYVAAIAPGIHEKALGLLQNLFYCVGTNAFIEGTAIEQLLASEFKWLQEKPEAFEKVKIQLYDTLITWLVTTGGIVTDSKTLSLWINTIGCDTRIEKDVIELKILSKPKPGKSVKVKSLSSGLLSINPAGTTTATSQTYVQKSSRVCQAALKTLTYLIPSLDSDNHRKIYEHVVKTASILTQFDIPPSPFTDAPCRLLIFETLTKMAYAPQRQSPVSVTLIVSLLRQGVLDTAKIVSSFCSSQISNLERLMHPISAPLVLAGSIPIPVALDNEISSRVRSIDENELCDEEMVDDNDDDSDSNSDKNQAETGVPDETHKDGVLSPFSLNDLESIIKQSVENVLRNYPMTSKINATPVIANPKKLVRSGHVMSSFTSDTPSVTAENDNVVDLDDGQVDNNVQSTPNERSKTNGNSHYVQNGDSSSDDDDLQVIEKENVTETNGTLSIEEIVNSKRKNPAFDDVMIDTDEVVANEITKKAKASSPSPTKLSSPSVEVVDGPSIQEMMESFVDLQPAT